MEHNNDMPGFGVNNQTEPYEDARAKWMKEMVELLATTANADAPDHTWACRRIAFLLRNCEFPVWVAHAVREYQVLEDLYKD